MLWSLLATNVEYILSPNRANYSNYKHSWDKYFEAIFFESHEMWMKRESIFWISVWIRLSSKEIKSLCILLRANIKARSLLQLCTSKLRRNWSNINKMLIYCKFIFGTSVKLLLQGTFFSEYFSFCSLGVSHTSPHNYEIQNENPLCMKDFLSHH